MNRSPSMRFFRRVLPGILLVSLGLRVSSQIWGGETEERPNILFAIADDWGWPHAGAYGDPVVQTPTFDRIAREGVLFTRAHVIAPTCTASRGGILTGQAAHRLEEGANLHSRLPAKFRCYPDILEEAGYAIGIMRKAWGPGVLEGTGRQRNPAGPQFRNFEEFLKTVPDGRPFCFWFGSTDPHRPYEKGSGVASGMDLNKIRVPPFLPDTPVVRSDIADYYFEVQRFDRELGEVIKLLEATGRLDNTLIIVTGDNGMPFPKAKATCYDAGTHVPLAVCWKAKVPGGRVVDDFISLTDVAPTILEAAGLKPLPEMTGKSFLSVLLSHKSGRVDPSRDHVFTERERHTCTRPNNASYPIRSIVTERWHLIWNLRPHLWPAGNPPEESVGRDYGDIDGSPTWTEMLQRQNDPAIRPFFLAAGGAKRPEFELFDLLADPGEMNNLAGKPEVAAIEKELKEKLQAWMRDTGDPRASGDTDFWDRAPYYGDRPKPKTP
ncbi:MAG TPA: sulfatase [Thermogutta sp.]|mgnify:FL=1|nr:sulfatase [Thermogutta sp.]